MIDFWEAVGRLATYADLNDEFLEVLPAVGLIPHASGPVKTYKATGIGLEIPQNQYETVQNFFAPILTENYLSLMSAGELLWTYSFQDSRDAMRSLLKLTSQASPEIYGPSTRYFITVGMLIVDEIFRHNLQSKGADVLKVVRRLSDPENDHIINLANDCDFEAAATNFSRNPWDGGCNTRLVYWKGHLHPLGIDAGAWQSGKETPPEAAVQYVQSSAN